MNKGL